ncbi:MAG: acetyl-CoA carboxylase biotin carboxyl carrier protein [Acutalibacteraceae bacterium]
MNPPRSARWTSAKATFPSRSSAPATRRPRRAPSLCRARTRAAPIPAAAPAQAESGRVVKSPLAGVFYAASSPDATPFVQAGDRVKKGETLCIIEAMKVMNELTADADGEVEAVLAENGQIVEYGQPLFRLKD